MCSSFVYIVVSAQNGLTYAGLTTDLIHRVWQHRTDQLETLDAPAGCAQLVWYAKFDTPEKAKIRLDQLRRWPQAWIARLIEERNPDWGDLWTRLEGQPIIDVPHAERRISPPIDPANRYPVLRTMLQVA